MKPINKCNLKMEQHKTYTLKGRRVDIIWIFRYNLDGSLYSFTIHKGILDAKQYFWLFTEGRFPLDEKTILEFKKYFSKYFIIEEINPKMDFPYFWETYNKKALKKQASDYWKKMKEEDRILAILGIKKYREYCEGKRQDMQDAIRYLKNRRYED